MQGPEGWSPLSQGGSTAWTWGRLQGWEWKLQEGFRVTNVRNFTLHVTTLCGLRISLRTSLRTSLRSKSYFVSPWPPSRWITLKSLSSAWSVCYVPSLWGRDFLNVISFSSLPCLLIFYLAFLWPTSDNVPNLTKKKKGSAHVFIFNLLGQKIFFFIIFFILHLRCTNCLELLPIKDDNSAIIQPLPILSLQVSHSIQLYATCLIPGIWT